MSQAALTPKSLGLAKGRPAEVATCPWQARDGQDWHRSRAASAHAYSPIGAANRKPGWNQRERQRTADPRLNGRVTSYGPRLGPMS